MTPDPPQPRTRVDHYVPTGTIVKLLVVALVVWAIIKLWPEMVFLSISLLLAIALEPLTSKLTARGLSRGTAVLILTVVMLAVVGTVLAFVLPPLMEQVANLAGDFPAFHERLVRKLRPGDTVLRKIVDQLFLLPSSPEFAAEVKPMAMGQSAFSGLMTAIFVVISTIYLLLDGKRLYAWLLAYVPRAHRAKMAETIPEVSQVVYDYVRGQFLTSLVFSIFAAITLMILKVPAVFPLALLAAVCDVVPVVGIIIAVIPAALLALTVTPVTAVFVVVAYLAYHQVEAYVIVPRVYGSTLRLSTLAVLLALIAGSTLQGLLGAVMVLPIVAAYPIIERIWLKGYLAAEVIADHKALAHAAEIGSDAAMVAVLQGQKHAGERSTGAMTVAPKPK